jgi:hypothetical protein
LTEAAACVALLPLPLLLPVVPEVLPLNSALTFIVLSTPLRQVDAEKIPD